MAARAEGGHLLKPTSNKHPEINAVQNKRFPESGWSMTITPVISADPTTISNMAIKSLTMPPPARR